VAREDKDGKKDNAETQSSQRRDRKRIKPRGRESKEGCDKVRKWEYGYEETSRGHEEAGEID
jgi:hypothetical protein